MSGALQKQHQKILRTLMRSPSNKKCVDCGEQCAVNVDTTHGIFVCTNCSGIHREHGDRIKSVSMATFTEDEINLLQSQTNEDFNRVWMAKWKQGEMPLPLNADDNRRRAFLQAKYVEKRWHSKRAQAAQQQQQILTNQQWEPYKQQMPPQQPENPFNTQPQQQILTDQQWEPYKQQMPPQQGENPFNTQPQQQNHFGPPQQQNQQSNDLLDLIDYPAQQQPRQQQNNMCGMPQQGSLGIPQQGSLGIPQQGNLGIPQQGNLGIPQQGSLGIPQQGNLGIPQQGNLGIPQQGNLGIPQQGNLGIPQQGNLGIPQQGNLGIPQQGNLGIPQQGNLGIPQQGSLGIPQQGSLGIPQQGSLGIPQQGSLGIPQQGNLGIPQQGNLGIPQQGNLGMPQMGRQFAGSQPQIQQFSNPMMNGEPSPHYAQLFYPQNPPYNSQYQGGYSQKSSLPSSESQSAVPNDEVERLKRATEEQALIIKQLRSDLADSKKEIERLQEDLKECDEIIKASVNSANPENDPKSQQMVFLDSDAVRSFEKVCELGHGVSGTVYKVTKAVTENKTFVLKVMSNSRLSHDNFQSFFKEYEILNMLFHPNVLKTYGFFTSDESMPPSILLEYCPNDVEKAVKNKTLTKSDTIVIIFQIAEGMKYVHFRNIMHRDLKPSNILIAADGTIRIADFGISKLMTAEEQQTTMTNDIGTLNFMAPEISGDQNYDKKVDVYSFGMLVLFILNEGKLPNRTLRQIINGDKFQMPDNFTQFSKDLINACLENDPNVRPDFNTICDEIEKGGFQLLNLSNDEKQEVNKRIKQFKRKIPYY